MAGIIQEVQHEEPTKCQLRVHKQTVGAAERLVTEAALLSVGLSQSFGNSHKKLCSPGFGFEALIERASGEIPQKVQPSTCDSAGGRTSNYTSGAARDPSCHCTRCYAATESASKSLHRIETELRTSFSEVG
jgi:hypothetical protein